jgi:phosphoribosyl-ATP pyrophosphohydrolase
MVLWSDAGLKPEDIFDVLKQRQGISGIEEKKLRQ